MAYDWDGTRTKRINRFKTFALVFILYSTAAVVAAVGALFL